MKKASEIYSKYKRFANTVTKDEFENVVKIIQKDAIEHTLKVAAKKAETKKDIAIFQEGTFTCDIIDENSILSLKDELFKKLNNEKS